MSSQLSRLSQQSLNSEALQKVAQSLNASRLHRLLEEIDEDTMKAIWNGFGLYVSRQMRMGRGVSLNRFGTFSFGPSEFNNEGMTVQRKQPRQPIFLVSPELVKGGKLKSSVFCTQTNNLRPFISIANGILPVTPLNYTELCQMLSQPSDKCKAAIYRMIITLSQKIIQDGRADLELPGVGYLLVKNGLCGFQFFQSFIEATKNAPSLTLEEKRERGDMTLNSKNLSLLEAKSIGSRNDSSNALADVEIDSSMNQYLENNLGIQVQKPEHSEFARSDYFTSFKKRNASLRLKPSFSFTQKSFHSSMHRSFTSKPQKSISQSIIQLWLIQNQLSPSESFMKLFRSLEQSQGQTDKFDMNIEQFRIAAASNNLKLAPEMIEEVFRLLDIQNKGFISLQDWTRVFSTQEEESKDKKALEQLRQSLNRKGILTAADVIKEMFGYSSKDSEDSKLLGIEQISQYLKKLDTQLTFEQAQSIAKEILFQLQEEQIKRQTLAAFLAPKESEGKEWFKKLMLKLNAIFSASSWDGLEQLKEAFASYDTGNEGLLDVASFKILLLKSNLNLDILEINHIIDFLDRDSHDRINYFKFLQDVKDTQKRYQAQRTKVYDEIDFLERIQRHILATSESPAGFLQMLRKNLKINNEASSFFNVTPKILAAYLKKALFEDEDLSVLERLSEKVDMNHDGVIDTLDLQYYLKNTKFTQQSSALSEVNPSERIQYLPLDSYGRSKRQSLDRYSNQSSNKQRSNSQTKIIYSFNGSSEIERNKSVGSNATQQQQTAFPVIPLSEEKLNQVLRDLRKKIDSKGISFKHFCELLDGEKTGLISASSFLKNIDNFIHLSEATKEGLFANIDKLHIGMIDQKRLLSILEKSILSTGSEEVSEDNWQWQDDVLQKMYSWYVSKGFESEAEAFRVMDYQFKGSVERCDLKRFVKEFLKIPETDITDARINRLFKIFDFYKSGRLTFLDFSKFLQQQRNIRKLLGFNPSTRSNSGVVENDDQYDKKGEKSTSLKEEATLTLDWKSSVQQQLGLALSRLFATTSEGFETISDSKGKITFEVFEKWLDKTNALNGFDLTKTLLQEFFAFLDPHKKGFLSEIDWNQAFEGIQWKKQMAEQIRSLILLHFSGNPQPSREAFKFFIQQEKTSNQHDKISLQGFVSSLNYLYPRRFNENDLKAIWKSEINTSNSEQELDFDQFKRFFSKQGTEYNSIHLQKQSSIEAINRLKRDILFYPSKHSSHNSSETQLNRAKLVGNKLNSSSAVISKKEQPNNNSYSSLSPFRSYAPISVTGKKAYSPSRNIKLEEIKLQNILQGGQFFSDNAAPKFHHHHPSAKSVHEILSRTNKIDLKHHYSFHEKSKSGINSLFGDYSALTKSNNSSAMDLSSINNSRIYDTSRQAADYGEQILKKLRRISRSAKEIEAVFRKYDELGVGSLTNLQLRNAFQELHLGLDSRELGFFLNLCDPDGRLQISKLVNILDKQAPEDLMIQQRGKIRLQELARDITNKMLSPEDAFRRFTKGEAMTFQEFQDLKHFLSLRNSRTSDESLAVMKDIFNFIDRNSDGYIDIKEWMDSFRMLGRQQYSSEIRSKRVKTGESNLGGVVSVYRQNMSSIIHRIPSFQEISQDYTQMDKIEKAIVKNRKYLMETFSEYAAAKKAITVDLAAQVIGKMLQDQGILANKMSLRKIVLLGEIDKVVDYKKLFDICKDKIKVMQQ